jgi:hypothetical protein
MQVRLALFLSALLAVFGMSTALASASSLGDVAVKNDAPKFRLNPYTLEPGCFLVGSHSKHNGVDVDGRVDVTQLVEEGQITVKPGTQFSVDQALIPGEHSGYRVVNNFDTGAPGSASDEDIDPNQTATDLKAPGTDDIDEYGVIVCVSDHPTDQNEPYVSDGLPGEVAAINRPIVAPGVSALGVSAVEGLNTYKVGFGYTAERPYDDTWKDLFLNDAVIGPGLSFGDPQAFDFNHDGHFDHVFIKSRVKQDGVRRYNDIDEFGEEFNNGPEKDSYGQPVIFDTDNGDPYAYLHKSLPGTVDGGNLLDVFQEAFADQTSALGLLTFTAQGDLPITWSLKPSLAPESYGRDVTLDSAFLASWNKQWQDYYDCQGNPPSLPLAPGTNPPASDDGNDCNPVPPGNTGTTAAPAVTTTNNTTTTIVQQVASGKSAVRSANGAAAKKSAKSSIRSAKVIRTKTGKRLVVFVKSTKATARIQIRMYGANGRKVGSVNKTVATNRSVKVNTRLAGKVKTVKVVLLG